MRSLVSYINEGASKPVTVYIQNANTKNVHALLYASLVLEDIVFTVLSKIKGITNLVKTNTTTSSIKNQNLGIDISFNYDGDAYICDVKRAYAAKGIVNINNSKAKYIITIDNEFSNDPKILMVENNKLPNDVKIEYFRENDLFAKLFGDNDISEYASILKSTRGFFQNKSKYPENVTYNTSEGIDALKDKVDDALDAKGLNRLCKVYLGKTYTIEIV